MVLRDYIAIPIARGGMCESCARRTAEAKAKAKQDAGGGVRCDSRPSLLRAQAASAHGQTPAPAAASGRRRIETAKIRSSPVCECTARSSYLSVYAAAAASVCSPPVLYVVLFRFVVYA